MADLSKLPPPPAGYTVTDQLPPPPAGYTVEASPRSSQPDFKEPEGSAASRYGSGLWSTTLGGIGASAKLLVDAARAHLTGSPVSTETALALGGIVQAHADQAQKMKDSWNAGNYSEAFGHALATALPAVGPAAAHAGERMGGEAPEFDRFGNVTKQGEAPDLAGGFGEATGLVISSSPRNIVKPVLAPLARASAGSVLTAADRAGVPEFLERSAGKNYRKMLSPTAKDVVPQAEAIAGGPSPSGPTGLVKQRPIALTRGGMMKQAQAGMDEMGPQTATVYNDKPPLDPKSILDHLEGIRLQKAVVKGTGVVSDPGLNSAIDEIRQNIEDMRGQDGKVSAAALDDFKDKLFRGNVSPKGHMRALAPQTASAIEQSVAGKIGNFLDTAYPDAAEVNATYRTAKQTHNFLEQQRRAEVAAESGVRTGSSSGFGAALKKAIPAPLRGIPNALSALTDSVAWDSVNGATKAKISELIRGGSWDTAAEAMKPLPKLLTQGDVITPPPPDTSGTRVYTDSEYALRHGAPGRNQRLLPPGQAPFTQGTSVPDVAGRPKGPGAPESRPGRMLPPGDPTKGQGTIIVPPPGAQRWQIPFDPRVAAAPEDTSGVRVIPGEAQVPQAEPSVIPPGQTQRVIDMNTQPAPHGQPAGSEWWAQQPPLRNELQLRYEQLFNRAENLSPQRPVRVPETGIPEGVARGIDARRNIATQVLNGRSWEQATAAERNVIDQLVSEGYGSAQQPRPTGPPRLGPPR